MKIGYGRQETRVPAEILVGGGVKLSKECYKRPEAEINRFEAEDMAMSVTCSPGASGPNFGNGGHF